MKQCRFPLKGAGFLDFRALRKEEKPSKLKQKGMQRVIIMIQAVNDRS